MSEIDGMPFFTQHYNLGTKLNNEQYSASNDKRRWTITDNQLGFLSDLIGDGRINGWSASSPAPYTLRIDAGVGLINRFSVQSYGPVDYIFDEDGIYYALIQRRVLDFGGFSAFTSALTLTYTDTTPPSAPTSFAVASSTFDSITLNWDANSEADFGTYQLFRSIDNTPSGWAAIVDPIAILTVPNYVDSGLDEQTTYYYRLFAYDLSDNASPYAAVNGTTPANLTVPADPRSVIVYSGNGLVQTTWLDSPDSIVSGYSVVLQKLDGSGNDSGSPTTVTVAEGINQYIFSGLINGTTYRITVSSISVNSVLSAGVSVLGVPVFADGPAEVLSVTLTQTWDGFGVTVHLFWTNDTGNLATSPLKNVITITEDESLVSLPITIEAGSAFPFGGFTSASGFNAIKEKTKYTFRVQGQDANGVNNVGVTGSITTSKFSAPLPVVITSVNPFQNKFLQATWTNPTGDFDHILLSLVRVDLNTHTSYTLLFEQNVARATTFSFEGETLKTNSTYTVTITVVDSAGNRSVQAEDSLSTTYTIPLPLAPTVLDLESGPGYMRFAWNPSTSPNIQSYRVWRTESSGYGLQTVSWVLLDELRVGESSFNDYDVAPGQDYGYTVTGIDTFDNESPGTGVGEFPDMIVYGSPSNDATLTQPTGFTGSVTSGTANLSWNAADDFFDGWHIFRSVGNFHEYVLLAALDRDQTSYADTTLSLQGGLSYNYILRKYANDLDLVVSTSPALPPYCLQIARVSVSSGIVTADETSVMELENLVGPVTAEAERRIRLHHHTYFSDADDRRISLNSYWIVSDWTTLDNIVFTTSQSLADTTTFTIYVNGSPTNLLAELDTANGTLTFSGEGVTGTVYVIFDGIEETQGILPPQRIQYISASNFTQDYVNPAMIPQISHDGRIRELLVPVGTVCSSNNGVTFAAGGSASQTATTFYDLITTGVAGSMLAATSAGILSSDDYGISWTTSLTTRFASTKLQKASISDLYFALAINTVYVASSLLTDWTTYDGLVGVSIIRDIVEDPAGIIYVSTDVGVFKLDTTLAEREWSQCALVSFDTSDCYALFFDSGISAVAVSTEEGVFYSTDSGQTWTLWTAFPFTTVVYQIIKTSLATFAIGNTKLFRRTGGTFEELVEVPAGSRKMAFFNSELYLATEAGVLTSVGDAEADSDVTFVNILPQLAEFSNRYVATSLNIIDSRLYLGIQGMLFSSTSHGVANIQYQESQTVAPTFFVNGVPRNLGVYNTVSWVSFETRLQPDDVVEAVRTYRKYAAPGGGWSGANFKAPVTVYVNAAPINDPSKSVFSGGPVTLKLPTLTTRNSVLDKATLYLEEVNTSLGILNNSFTSANMALLVEAIELLNGEMDPSLAIAIPSAVGVLSMLPNSPVQAGTFNTGTGVFQLSGTFGKYTQLSVDVLGVTLRDTGHFTHQQIDDTLEQHLSGLSAGLAKARQVNLVKCDLYRELQSPGARVTLSPPSQEEIFENCYLDWYDNFNSTIDYTLRVRKLNNGVSLQYPMFVLALEDKNEVWAAGLGGVISISTVDLTVQSKYARSGFVKYLFRDGDNVYMVANDGLYNFDLLDQSVSRDNGVGFPASVNTVTKAYDNLIVGADDGIYLKGLDGNWTNVLPMNGGRVQYLGDLLIAYDTNSQVWSSPSGDGWTDKGAAVDPSGIPSIINSVVRFETVFFATTTGLYEDGMTFYSQEIVLALPNFTDDPLLTDNINDIATDGTTLVVGLAIGTYLTYVGGVYTAIDESVSLGAIHRVLVVGGNIWLFGYDKLKVVTGSGSSIVKLATGNRLTWQT